VSSARDGRALRDLVQLVGMALWLGAALFFTLVVAPAAFSALPSRELAGGVVGRILPALFIAGAVLGLLVLGLDLTGARRSARGVAAALVVISCAIAQLGVAPRIAALRAAITEPLATLATDHPQRVAFGRLHMMSVAWLGVAMLAAVAVLIMVIRSRRASGLP
jgi:hypothetical protein